MALSSRIKVLIVDDSAIVRKILSEALAGETDIEIVGTAPDPYVARDKILALNPDVLTLDIEMPRMDGLTFLERLMRFHPLPVIVISSLAQPACRIALKALETGAVDVVAKPGGPYSVGELRVGLAQKIRAAAAARVCGTKAESVAGTAPPRAVLPSHPDAIIAIGASTGGTEAIAAVLSRFPSTAPATVVVQHIPPQFSGAFAGRLNEICAMEVREARDGDALRPGLALVAPGDLHMTLRKGARGAFVSVKTGPRVCYQRPSVDVLFHSVAETAGGLAVAALLTGMGSDGAAGLLRLRRAGARTIAQNEETCVVFGMPREAIEIGAAEQVLPLGAIAEAILNTASRLPSVARANSA